MTSGLSANHDVSPEGYYAHHGRDSPGAPDELSNTLSLSDIFIQLAQWADAGDAAVNHGQEIIMFSLAVERRGAGFPDRRMPASSAVVVNMVTPDCALDGFRDRRPGLELTFGQLWSLPKQPGLENVARVIMDNQPYSAARSGPWCSGVPSRRTGQTLFLGLLREPVQR